MFRKITSTLIISVLAFSSVGAEAANSCQSLLLQDFEAKPQSTCSRQTTAQVTLVARELAQLEQELSEDYRYQEDPIARGQMLTKINTELTKLIEIGGDRAMQIFQQERAKLQLEQKKVAIQVNIEKRHKQEIIRKQSMSIIDGRHAIFHRVEPGKFKMGQYGRQVDVQISKAFAMMATLTTQEIWRAVAQLAHLKLADPELRLATEPSHFRGPTRPVELVSFNDVQIWIRCLNSLSLADEPLLYDLIKDHQKGDIYRLPTEAEWEYVMRGGGVYNELYHFGNDEAKLDDYAWSLDNSNNQTHPVALKKPLLFAGHDFYDMHGNVSEWVFDRWQLNLPGGLDPIGGVLEEPTRVARGGSWSTAVIFQDSAYRTNWYPDAKRSTLGFRLVRDLRADEQ